MKNEPKLLTLKLAEIIPSPHNKRAIRADDPDIRELAESIKATGGAIQPILVRRLPLIKTGAAEHPEARYVLVAGERRWMATRVAGLDEIRAMVVETATDVEAEDLTLIENLVRKDLTPMETARSIQALITRGQDPKQIAAMSGKHLSWVYRRAALAGLSPTWQKAIEDKSHAASKASAKHLELVARFAEHVQNKLLKTLSVWQIESPLADFERVLMQNIRALKAMPWDQEHALGGVPAPACVTCPQRSARKPDLFDELKKDCCLDPLCYERKEAAFLYAREKALTIINPDLVKVSRVYGSTAKGVLNMYDFREAKKEDPGAVQALVVKGGDLGKTCWITKTNHGTQKTSNQKPNLKHLREELETSRWSAVTKRLAAAILETPLDRVRLPKACVGATGQRTFVLALAGVFGTGEENEANDTPEAYWKLVDERLRQPDRLVQGLWLRVRARIAQDYKYAWRLTAPARERAAALIGFDLAETYAAVAKEPEFQEPPGWAKQEEKAKTEREQDAHATKSTETAATGKKSVEAHATKSAKGTTGKISPRAKTTKARKGK